MLSSSSISLPALKFCLDPEERQELEEKVLEWVGLRVCGFKSEIAFSGIDNAKLSNNQGICEFLVSWKHFAFQTAPGFQLLHEVLTLFYMLILE